MFALAAQAAGATLRIARRACRATYAMPRGHDLDAIARGDHGQRRGWSTWPIRTIPPARWFGRDAFAAFMAQVPEHVVVVIDEAYAEMADADADAASALPLLAAHPQPACVTRTFSKAYGAGRLARRLR